MYTDEQLEGARTLMDWVKAYLEAGFSREEAMRITVAHIMRPVPQALPPDLEELMAKTRLVVDDALEHGSAD